MNLFYTAITRAKKELYLTASCLEECSRFIKYLDPNLIELLPSNLRLTPTSLDFNQHTSLIGSIAEIIGEQGEEKVWQLLDNNKKIKFEKLVKNWQEIEDLQIDIYGETAENVYFIEVKDWSESFYYSSREGRLTYQKKILEQQIYHQGKIRENFSSTKEIIYLINLPTGELANDLQSFLRKKEFTELVVTHHDKVHGKTWEAEYNVKRIDA